MKIGKTTLPLLALLALHTAGATTRTVSNLNDSGAGSLRDTIVASAAGDAIEFSVTGTITLTGVELGIGRDLAIMGPPAGLTVSGNGNNRVFYIVSGATVNFSNLTITNGHPVFFEGGGILNGGTLTLNNCTVAGNHSETKGAGIYNGGSLTLNSCVLSGNFGPDVGGGGIYNGGTMTINNCTLSSNSVSSAKGGGIYNGGTATIHSCTIGGNSALSGGGIANAGNLIVLNTIIADNRDGGSNHPDADGPVTSEGHNLVGKADGSSGWLSSDLIGTFSLPLNPLLGSLQANGGPTMTMTPMPGSAAIDAGDDFILNTLATDQRGRPRKSGAHVDIGACEVSPAPLVTNTDDSGAGSLRAVILVAAPGDNVNFASGVVGTITLTSGELVFGKNLTINGPGAKVLTISGNNASRVFHITDGVSTISNLRIANGRTSSGGGGILVDNGSLTLNNCAVAGCYALGADVRPGGGGIFLATPAILSLVGCTLSGNSTPYYGGGLYVFNGAHATLVNCTISGNSTLDGSYGDAWGGGILVDRSGSVLNVTNSTIANNSSVSGGGGIYRISGTITVANSLIAGNSTTGTGPDCKGAFVSSGYNLIGNSSGSTGFSATGDQMNMNPLLGPLADNGGPTFTHALLTGSPAIDKGYRFGVGTDQRGRLRPYDFPAVVRTSNGDESDIGAFEVSPPLLTIVRAGNKVILAWPVSDAGYTLEAKTSLNASATWSAVPGTPSVVGSQYNVTNIVAPDHKIYRLRNP